MLFTSFAQNQPNAFEDRKKSFAICFVLLKIPGIFVRKPGKREAKISINPGNSRNQDFGFQTPITACKPTVLTLLN